MTHSRLVLEADVRKIVGTNLQPRYLAAVFKVIKQRFFVDFLVDVPHDDGQFSLELLRRFGRQHEEALAAKVLLVPGQQQRHIGFAGHPDKRREGPLRALLFLQEVNLQHRGRLFQVLHQLFLFGRRRNVLHIDELLSVHCAAVKIWRQQKSSSLRCASETTKIELNLTNDGPLLFENHFSKGNGLKNAGKTRKTISRTEFFKRLVTD